MKKIFKNKYNFISLLIYIIPTIIAALFALIAATIFIKYLSPQDYANYLIQHLILSFGSTVISFYIGKVTVIGIKNFSSINKKLIIINSLFFIILAGLILSFLIYVFLFFFINELSLTQISIVLFFGILTSSIYANLEEIAKGIGMVKTASLGNFFFMNGSVSIPGFILLVNNNEIIKYNLFNISVFIKLLVLVQIFFLIYSSNKTRIIRINFNFFKNNINQNFYLLGVGIIAQIYSALDKYLIKLYLSPTSLIIFSLSQQISSKFGILSGSCNSLMIGQLIKYPNLKNSIISANLYFCFYISSLTLLVLINFIDPLIVLFFKKQITEDTVLILKLFLFINLVSVLKDCLSGFLQFEFKTNKELNIDIFLLPLFLTGLYFGTHSKSLIIFCIIILIKELFLLLSKVYYTKNNVLNYKSFLLEFIFFAITILIDLLTNLQTVKYMAFLAYIILTLNNLKVKLIKNYFIKSNNV